MKLLIISALFFSSSLSAQEVPAATRSKLPQDQAIAALEFHNKVRKDVGVGPLTWSVELSAYAQSWAEQLTKKDCRPKHRPPTGEWKQLYGENIFWGSKPGFTALTASQHWFSEIKDFDGGPIQPELAGKTGHYTQMVWHNTKSIGMGIAQCPNGAIIIVANYDPAGNYVGEKAY
jgi:pathogenesis-related protein 1